MQIDSFFGILNRLMRNSLSNGLNFVSDTTSSKPNMLRDEFMLNMNKFVQQIRRTLNQIEGRFGLEIPEDAKAIQHEDPKLLSERELLIKRINF